MGRAWIRPCAGGLTLVALAACATPPIPIPPVAERHVDGAEHVQIPEGPVSLDAWLFRPRGPGPWPAVVALHGCEGLYDGQGAVTSRYRDWATRLVALGYAVLLPDSFSARKLHGMCSADPATTPSRTADAWAGLRFLQSQSAIRPDAVALMGWDTGGTAALAASEANNPGRPADLAHDFRAFIALYPDCREALRATGSAPVGPVNVLIGELDDWSAPSDCSELAAQAKGRGGRFDLQLYPGAYHLFDEPSLPQQGVTGIRAAPNGKATVGTNPEARADSIERVTRDLRAAFSKPAP